MYLPDVPPNGEETAANGAPPHFRIKRNFLGVNSSFAILFFWSSLDEVKYYRCVPVMRPPRCRRNENLRRSP